MKQHWITLTALFLAFICYIFAYGVGLAIFFGIGLISEAVFWVRLSRGRGTDTI